MTPIDRVATFFREKTPNRILALTAFVGTLLVFRKLLVLLAFFVLFERALFLTSGFLVRRFKVSKMFALIAVLLVGFGSVGIAGLISAGRLKTFIIDTRDKLPQQIEELKEHPLFVDLSTYLPDTEKLIESAKHYGNDVAHAASELGHFVLLMIIGLILAVVYFFDEPAVTAFRERLPPTSLFGTLSRWFGITADAVGLMIQLQIVVALCNAVLTLPVLLIIGVPHIPALMLLIFITGLIPVVGNLISGAVLILLAYQAKGIFGVAIFVALTFVLHKIESYYLNPRLTSRHVQLPGFVLILSLIAWEHLLGIVGLFVSFPFLFVAGKIRSEFKAEDDPPAAPIADGPAPGGS